MSTLLLHFHRPSPRDQDPDQAHTVATLQALAMTYLEIHMSMINRTDMTPEEANAYNRTLDGIHRNMRRYIKNATQNFSSEGFHKLDGYELVQLIYLLTGRNAEFE